MLFVTTLSFAMIRLAPGDPIAAALSGPRVSETVRNQWRAEFGLDRPIPEQYVKWISNIARGHLGYSFSRQRPVSDVLRDAMPNTLVLALPALLLSFGLGIVVGVLQAERPGSARDKWLGRVLLVLFSVPDFWLALVALLLFAYRLRLFPPGGLTDPVLFDYMSPREQLVDRLRHLVLPVATLTLLTSAAIARFQRNALLAVLPSPWMQTALAKGASWRSAVRRHALRNALLPVITLFGLSLPAFVAGTVFIEKVFSWPGMGLVTVSAVAARDYHLVTAGVLAMSILVVTATLVTDIAVAAADPRVRLG